MSNKIIYVHHYKKGQHYVKIPLQLLRGKKLSHQAFHLHCFLQSQAPTYNCMKWRMMEYFRVNKDTITKWLDELKDHGLAEIVWVETEGYRGYATKSYAEPQERIIKKRLEEKAQREKKDESQTEIPFNESIHELQVGGKNSPKGNGEKPPKVLPEKAPLGGGEKTGMPGGDNSQKDVGDKTPPIINSNVNNGEISRNNVVPESRVDSDSRSNISTTNKNTLVYSSDEEGEVYLSESEMDSYRKLQEESDQKHLELIKQEKEKRKAQTQS